MFNQLTELLAAADEQIGMHTHLTIINQYLLIECKTFVLFNFLLQWFLQRAYKVVPNFHNLVFTLSTVQIDWIIIDYVM